MTLRSAIDQVLIVLGVLIIVAVVSLLEQESWTPLIIVLTGILMVGLGVYRLGHRVLPNRRVYVGLRSEVEYFIRLVRRLNAHALRNEDDSMDSVRNEMRESVDRMFTLAGRPGRHMSISDSVES